MTARLVDILSELRTEHAALALKLVDDQTVLGADGHFPEWSHDGQDAPPGDWQTWVVMAGRGYGKTRAGAEWVVAQANANPGLRIALVAATLDEARKIMVEGASGLLAVGGQHIRRWFVSRGLIRFRSGAEATLFSGASPDMLRGPEHHIAWCDELAKWEKAQESWDMLQFGMRLGAHPRILVTTTPRPGPVLEGIMADKECVVTGGDTHRNPHTPKAFRDAVERKYRGTRLARQEIDGELLTDTPGALWSVELLERCRINPPRACLGEGDRAEGVTEGYPSVTRYASATSPRQARGGITLIGVDPPASAGGTCGIIACAAWGHSDARTAQVLADHSVSGRSPEGWARAVVAAAELHRADRVVVERNQGVDMVKATLRAASATLKISEAVAIKSKSDRAVPVALLFETGRVQMAGRFPELEAQLCGMIEDGGYAGPGRSPDRADAMVWALTELMLGVERAGPRIRVL